MKKIAFLLTLLTAMFYAGAQNLAAYQKQLFIHGADTLRYRILYPENYQEGKTYPLIVFLHGSGERGSDNEAQLLHGGDLFLKDDIRKQYPAIVVFPQCPADSFWNKFTMRRDAVKTEDFTRSLNASPELTTPELLVKLLMDSLAGKKIADKKRLYIGGLSLGGFGTYDLVVHYPNYFAAAFPICGQANTQLYTDRASKLPVWIFHGGMDNVVDPQPDRDLIKALQKVGAKNAKYTEYPTAGHNSWDSAFAEPKLVPWLLSFKK